MRRQTDAKKSRGLQTTMGEAEGRGRHCALCAALTGCLRPINSQPQPQLVNKRKPEQAGGTGGCDGALF